VGNSLKPPSCQAQVVGRLQEARSCQARAVGHNSLQEARNSPARAVGHNSLQEARSSPARAVGHSSLQEACSCQALAEGSQVRPTRLQGRRWWWRHRSRLVMLCVGRSTLLTC
jgi:hypothetical protein